MGIERQGDLARLVPIRFGPVIAEARLNWIVLKAAMTTLKALLEHDEGDPNAWSRNTGKSRARSSTPHLN